VAVIDISFKTAAGLDLMKRIKERDSHVCILVWFGRSCALLAAAHPRLRVHLTSVPAFRAAKPGRRSRITQRPRWRRRRKSCVIG
jgi:hypothetical protein